MEHGCPTAALLSSATGMSIVNLLVPTDLKPLLLGTAAASWDFKAWAACFICHETQASMTRPSDAYKADEFVTGPADAPTALCFLATAVQDAERQLARLSSVLRKGLQNKLSCKKSVLQEALSVDRSVIDCANASGHCSGLWVLRSVRRAAGNYNETLMLLACRASLCDPSRIVTHISIRPI